MKEYRASIVLAVVLVMGNTAARTWVRAAERPLQVGGSQSTTAEIVQLDREYHEERFRNDVAAVNRMLAPDYYAVNTNGLTREAGNTERGPFNTFIRFPWLKVAVCDHRSRLYGDAAVSTYHRQTSFWTPDGYVERVDFIVSHTWVKRDGRWMLVLTQATEIAEPVEDTFICDSVLVMPK